MVLCIKTLGKCKILKEESGWFAYGVGSNGNVIGAVCIAPVSCKTRKDVIAFIKANIDSNVIMVD